MINILRVFRSGPRPRKLGLRRSGTFIAGSLLLPSLALACQAQPDQGTPPLATEVVLSDMRALVAAIERGHPSPLWRQSQENWEQVQSEVEGALRGQVRSREGQLTQLLRIVASVRDGHTRVPTSELIDEFGSLPVRLRWYRDELVVENASMGLDSLLGWTVVGVGGRQLPAIRDLIRPVVPHAAPSGFMRFSPRYLVRPGILFGLDISESPHQAEFRLRSPSGKEANVRLARLTPTDEPQWAVLDSRVSHLPVSRRSVRAFDLQVLEESQTLYARADLIGNTDEESIFAFADSMGTLLQTGTHARVLLDLRWNGGGSFPFGLAIVAALREYDQRADAGAIQIAVGPGTYSAAVQVAAVLQQQTRAVIVGEPSGGALNAPGDNEEVVLEGSGLEVEISAVRHRTTFPWDNRDALTPALLLAASAAERLSGVDPLIDAVQTGMLDPPSNATDLLLPYGTYEFFDDRVLRIAEGPHGPVAVVRGKAVSPIIRRDGEWRVFAETAVIRFTETGISARTRDGQARSWRRVAPETEGPYDLAWLGRLPEAAAAYRLLDGAENDRRAWVDDAARLYFELRADVGRLEAGRRARGLLDIGLALGADSTRISDAKSYYPKPN